MLIVDCILKPVDSYWKRQYNTERIRKESALADAKCSRGFMDEQEKQLDLLHEKCVAQSRAIEAMNLEREALNGRIRALETEVKNREKEIDLLRDTVRAEREAKAALKTNARLWESLKASAKEDRNDAHREADL